MPVAVGVAGNAIDTAEAAQALLKSRSDLSYRLFDGLELSNVVARQSLFHGVLFRNCKISDCDFSRSDFEGARFESCTLANVSFETADIRSTKFAKTALQSCTFRSAVCIDNLFTRSVVENCDFEDASVLHSNFEKCSIQKTKNRSSAWLHTTFTGSKLANLSYTDCTSSYTIYDGCSFENVTINADSLGLTFGVTENDLMTLKFGFLGQRYDAGISPSIEDFLNEYQRRSWRVHSLILSLNFRPENTQPLLAALLQEIRSQISEDNGAKHDDLEFVFRIMALLKSKQRLPFAAAIFAYNTFAELASEIGDQILEKKLVETGQQKSQYLANNMYTELIVALSPLINLKHSDIITAKITYAARPKTSTLDSIDEAARIAKPKIPNSFLVDARAGSWIETVQLSLGSLFSFYVALYLVNGCLVQLTMLRARSKNLVAKRLPPKFLQAASDPSHDLPKTYNDILQKLISSQLPGKSALTEPLKAPSREEVDGMVIEVAEVSA